jgi:hypothetical protein
VISGFLITEHLGRELAESGGISFGAFYARRARRLLPSQTKGAPNPANLEDWTPIGPRKRDPVTDSVLVLFRGLVTVSRPIGGILF